MASSKQGNVSRPRRRDYDRPADLAEYQQYCNQVLGDPAKGLIGVLLTFAFFVCLMSLPWIVSFLQDEGIIRPRLHLRPFLPNPNAQEDEAENGEAQMPEQTQPASPYAGQRSSSAFGRPRQD